MAKKFRGDGVDMLPEASVTPYKLWFEALQLAYRANLKIDKKFYKEWGDVETASFNNWWSENWRRLFAASLGVREITRNEDFQLSKDKHSVIVRIPTNQTFTQSVAELRALYAEIPDARKSDKPKGKFHLRGKGDLPPGKLREKDIRVYLRAYELRMQGMSIHEVAVAYCDAIEDWNKKRGKRKPMTPSYPMATLARMVRDGTKITGATNEYRTVQRNIKRGRDIVANTAKGRFPGEYK